MKKLLSIVIAISLCVGIAACNKKPEQLQIEPQENPYAEVISQIYELDVSYYGESGLTGTFYHKNVVSDEMIVTQDFALNTKETFKTSKREYSLQYKESASSTLRCYKVHEYSINGDEEASAIILEDGTLMSILHYPIVQLEIAPDASPETVRMALEPAMEDLIDLSQYEYVNMPSENVTEEQTFGNYLFKYYNTIGDYRANFAYVQVNDDGIVDFFKRSRTVEDAEKCREIDKDIESAVILAKLKDIYDTENTEYSSHETFSMCIISCNNEVCVEYSMHCNVYFKEKDTTDCFHCTLLIPVRLLCGNEAGATA